LETEIVEVTRILLIYVGLCGNLAVFKIKNRRAWKRLRQVTETLNYKPSLLGGAQNNDGIFINIVIISSLLSKWV
jgi:hypothetical protein